MDTLQVHLFGVVRVLRGEQHTELQLPKKLQALFSYLLLNRSRTHSRNTLAGIFWGEQSQKRARECLNTAMWRLKTVLEPSGIPAGTYLLGSNSEEVGFNRESAYWLDVAVLETHANQILPLPFSVVEPGVVESLEKTLLLYSGDLLEGYYEDWALHEQERLRAIYLDCHLYLMQYYADQDQPAKGVPHAQKILQADPLREEVHRQLMRLYLASGQRSLAVHQYECCRQSLHKELGIEPLEETQALYQQVIHGEKAPARSADLVSDPAGMQAALKQLRSIKITIDDLQRRVNDTIQVFESLSDQQPK